MSILLKQDKTTSGTTTTDKIHNLNTYVTSYYSVSLESLNVS